MFDTPSNGLYPDDGSDFYVDEFGERIETPDGTDKLLDEDMPELETDNDSEAMEEHDEQMKDSEPTFNETIDRKTPFDDNIIEED